MKFFENEGYSVARIEHNQSIWVKPDPKKGETKGHIIYIKTDLWGGDIVAAHQENNEILWIQVKANKKHVSDGLKALIDSPLPQCVKKIVVHWQPRARQPDIYEATNS